MLQKSTVLKVGALCSTVLLMGGYVAYQAIGGEGKALPGSKAPSKLFSMGPKSTGPSTAPTTQPAASPAMMFSSSKSAAVFVPRTEEPGNTVGTTTLQPGMLPGSKSAIIFQPSGKPDSSTGITQIAGPGGTIPIVAIPASQPATPATRPSTQPAQQAPLDLNK